MLKRIFYSKFCKNLFNDFFILRSIFKDREGSLCGDTTAYAPMFFEYNQTNIKMEHE